MQQPTEVVALTFADGSIGRMQFYAQPTDAAIAQAISKTKWAQPVTSWVRRGTNPKVMDAALSAQNAARAPAEPSSEERLERRLGVTVDDLKKVLGIG